MQDAPERAHGGVCLLSESILGHYVGQCAAIVDGSTADSPGVCAPGATSCMMDEVFYDASKQYEDNDTGCVVENSKYGSCRSTTGGQQGWCAWSPDDCTEDEIWRFPDHDCRCDKVKVGGCQKNLGEDLNDRTIYCAVSPLGCDEQSTFIDARNVQAEAGYECYLCRKSAEDEEDVVDNMNGEDAYASQSYSADPSISVVKLVAYMDQYPGTSTPPPEGSVLMYFYDNGDITIELYANKLTKGCNADANTNKNGCGVHIHAGTSCDVDALGHYYRSSTMAEDPWANVRYDSDVLGMSTSRTMDGSKKGHMVMYGGNGYDAFTNKGHTVVVHDAEGNRIGCGLLQGSDDDDDGTLLSMNQQQEGTNAMTKSGESSDDTLLIGGIVTGILASCVIVFFAMVLYRRNNRLKKYKEELVESPPAMLNLQKDSIGTQSEADDLSVL